MEGRSRIRPSLQGRLALQIQQSMVAEMQNLELAKAAGFPVTSAVAAKPYDAPITSPSLDRLLKCINSLDVNDKAMLQKIQFCILNFCSSTQAMEICIQRCHDQAMVDPAFGSRAAAALATASNLIIDGLKMRNILMKSLQDDYTKSEELRKINKSKFLNMVGFLGQVFSRFRLNGEPIKVLAVSHLVYQRRLLEGDDTELELCMLLWAQNGQLLAQCQPSDSTLLTEFVVKIMSRLLKEDLDKITRGWLMLGYHMHSKEYELSPEYLDLFAGVLGLKSMSRIVYALNVGRTALPVQVLEEKSLAAFRAGPPKEGCGDVMH